MHIGDEHPARDLCIDRVGQDTHGQHQSVTVPPGDVLIHAGDFTMCGAEFEIEEFAQWFQALPHPYKVLVAGNHELCFDTEHFVATNSGSCTEAELRETSRQAVARLLEAENVIYLEDASADVSGLTIHGSPYQPAFK